MEKRAEEEAQSSDGRSQVRYEPQSNLLGMEYFLHVYGPIYALSADIVSSLVALRNNRHVFLSPQISCLST
ncbi:unnamed protein product [Lupinus luteus]|uniref:Uncharacterized protein n=1 Tax=Lupinus luteus TaxID=3873 RepID=A0AAV1W1R8_LUPLU